MFSLIELSFLKEIPMFAMPLIIFALTELTFAK